ncbi:hypothetical protein AB0B88_16110 [Micromonospora haikouensis]|uniref:hypothetical protein n=1 Tax=Micromonospora haikouensis TaxID=686309 RepID=UPI0033F324CD
MPGGVAAVLGVVILAAGMALGVCWPAITDWWFDLTEAVAAGVALVLKVAGGCALVWVLATYGLPLLR